MKIPKLLFPSVAFALLAIVNAQAQATLYGIGDLAGGKTYSQVNDATKVGGVIYAVGGSTATSATNNNDRAVLWTSTGGLTAIPDFVSNTPGTGGVVATAITSDGAYIAGRLHNNATTGETRAALIATSGLTTTNLGNLGTVWNSNAAGISNNGTTLFGAAQYSSNGALTQLVRYTSSAGSISALPFATGTNLTSTNMFITGQAGVSADGDKVVGITNNGGVISTPGTQAFLYIHSLTDLSTNVPYLTGGTWNGGIAINASGTMGLIAGNSTAFTNGELYLYNDTTNLALGSPNAAATFAGGAGLSDDTTVVSATFLSAGTPTGYIHNSNGWFSLDTVASASGANLTGWSTFNIFGLSSDATLVWGAGLHNGNTEGFVLEFSAGALAAIPEPSTYAALAGLGALGLVCWRRRNQARV